MKNIKITLIMGIVFLSVFAVSCKKDENPSVGFTMKAVDALTSDTPSNQTVGQAFDNAPLPLSWSTAWIYITSLEFNATFTDLSSVNNQTKYPEYHYSWQGNQQVDLLAKQQVFADIKLPDGLYEQIDIRLTSSRMGSFGTPNFFLSGTYGGIMEGTPIAVTVTQPFEMDIRSANAINTDNSIFFNGLIEVSLNRLFNGISATDLDNAQITDGWLLIDASHNVDLYNRILGNLQAKPENSVTWAVHFKQ